MGRIKFYADASKVGMPFISINVEGFQMIMMIDTGSTNNVLFRYVYQQVREQLREVETDYTITGIDGKPNKVICVVGNALLGGNRHEMSFLVREDDDAGIMLSQEMGFPVCGIIGTLFMAEHGWMLDFANQEVIYE